MQFSVFRYRYFFSSRGWAADETVMAERGKSSVISVCCSRRAVHEDPRWTRGRGIIFSTKFGDDTNCRIH